MENHEWAWLAGLFEGEGSVSISYGNCAQVRIGMTDKDVIETVHRLYPTRSMRYVERKGRRKTMYIWQVSNRDGVRAFLAGVLPYLHSRRRARALEALDVLKMNPGAKRDRTHCIRGHPLFGENLYVTPYGARQCITCRKARDQKRTAERQAYRAANPRPPRHKTHCKYGHPMTGDNLYVISTTGARQCRACRNRREREHQARKRQASGEASQLT